MSMGLAGLIRRSGFCAALSVFLFLTSAGAQDAAEKNYKEKCVMCHAADGSASSPAGKASKARDFCAPEVAKQTDAEFADVIVKGRNKMPAYDKKLTDEQIKQLVAYIRSACKKR
jgi:mono/diheme cytochrome c family protein